MHPGRTPAFPTLLLLGLVLAHVAAILVPGKALAQALPVTSAGDLYLSDWFQNRLVRIGSDGSTIDFLTIPNLVRPRGITMGPSGEMYVSSESRDRVLVLDASATTTDEITHADLLEPTGSALSPAGELYVSAYSTDKVLVFALDGTYLRTLSHPSLDGPNCVAFAPDGHLLVAGGESDNVVEFDTNDAYVADFTAGGLDSPMSIAFDIAGGFYVSGGLSNNVVQFDAGRAFVQSIVRPGFSLVQSLAIDDLGRLWVSNFSTNAMVVYDPGLGTSSIVTVIGGMNARGLAFAKVPPKVACRKGTVDARNGYPKSIFTLNGGKGDGERKMVISASAPLSFELATYPGAMPQIPYITFAWPRENRDQDATPFPRGSGTTCFPTPVTGGSSLVLFDTLGLVEIVGPAKVPGTPPGPGTILSVPRLNASAVGRTLTLFTVVPDRKAWRSGIGISNAVVVEIVE